MVYNGYNFDATSAFHITRRSFVGCKKQKTEQNLYPSFVFGPKNAGKSTLLKSFLGRASELLKNVARQDEKIGFGVPCIFIAAKADQASYSTGGFLFKWN